ncbi:MAG: putative bifunctional diguanylate cyclase/phosphodiesterase [Acidimicrobiales bacterium]
MSVKVVETSPQARGRGAVSGVVVEAVVGRVRARGGDTAVSQALALAGERRAFSDLADRGAWSTLAEAVALFDAAALVTGDGAICLHAGSALLQGTGDELVARVLSARSAAAALDQVGPLLRHFEGTSEAVLLEAAADHALVQVSPLHPSGRHAHLCELTRGLLSQLPVAFGSGPALITEPECSARGGRYCLYAMSWDDPSDVAGSGPGGSGPAGGNRTGSDGTGSGPGHPGPWMEPTGSELDRMRMVIEGAFATARELLHDDAESLLTEIAARADALVTARRYLLMVRVRSGTPVKLHHRGLEADEARALAAELWPGHPDGAAGTRLVVDIASGRHRYGRLVELLGEPAPPAEARLLRLYADHAATALDVFGVLDEARRSGATARTLLSFAERLSQVTTPADLVQLLADTVPAVAGCERSTVYLWEGDSGLLVPRARSAGRQPADAYLGPIVPLAVPGPSSHERQGRAGGSSEENLHPGATGASGREPTTPPEGPEPAPPAVRIGGPLADRLLDQRAVVVIDASSEDPVVRDLLARSGTVTSVVTPLFAAGEFLGVISANYGAETPADATRDPDLHERLSGLADQAATALQNLALLEKVSHMAWHDALTGLPNRRLFEDRVEQELVRSKRVGEPVCMFFVDVDYFKGVNDTLGHAAGDDLIRQVSRRLVDTVRRQDTVARVGGDEFAILLPGLSEQGDIDELAERTLDAMSTPFSVLGEDVETSASIGVAVAPEHGDSYDDLLNRADEAMYRAKSYGRNCFEMFSGPSSHRGARPPALDANTLQAELAGALERDELFVLYQPYIDLATSEVVGVEALVRWRHPRLGVLEPASFIPAAERSEAIVALDGWVLRKACEQAKAWFEDGIGPFRLAVNLASRDLVDPGLSARVDRTLAANGIDPSLLDLEITERVVLDRWGPAKENIERLRRLGVRFTIDDFGAGNSSLDRIGSFPVSTLKINQSFVQVLGPEGEDDSLVSAIIAMADRLGLECVAEGVETSLQSRVLLRRGCTAAQGYYFSPPLAAEDIGRLLATIAAEGPVVLGDGG